MGPADAIRMALRASPEISAEDVAFEGVMEYWRDVARREREQAFVEIETRR